MYTKQHDSDFMEIFSGGRWIEVSEWIFRSYTGERRLNNKPYNGPVYVLGTDTFAIRGHG